MLDLDAATLIFQIINFLVLLWALSKFLFKPLMGKMGARGQAISDTLQGARDQEAEAAHLKAEWEEKLRLLDEQREDTLQAAQVEASRRSAELMQEARIRLDRLTEEMRTDLDRQRYELVVRHYDEILDTIVAISGNVVQSVTTRRTHDDLVTNFAASIYQMPQSDVEEYRRLMAGRVPTAFVATPVALSADQTKTLSDTLSSLVDRRVELRVTIEPSLIAGIQVRLSDKLVDNSISQQLERIRDRVRSDLATRLGAST